MGLPDAYCLPVALYTGSKILFAACGLCLAHMQGQGPSGCNEAARQPQHLGGRALAAGPVLPGACVQGAQTVPTSWRIVNALPTAMASIMHFL